MPFIKPTNFDLNVQLFDQNLLGNPPKSLAKKTYFMFLNKNKTDFINVMKEMAAYADSLSTKKIANLYFFCHGGYRKTRVYTDKSNTADPNTVDLAAPHLNCGEWMGGQALKLGNFILEFSDIVECFDPIKNKVKRIIFYSCGIAGRATPEPPEEYDYSGSTYSLMQCFNSQGFYSVLPIAEKQFAMKLCSATNSHIVGGDFSQLYLHGDWAYRRVYNIPVLGKGYFGKYWVEYDEVDFGEWEGQLYEFTPPTGAYTKITRAGSDTFSDTDQLP